MPRHLLDQRSSCCENHLLLRILGQNVLENSDNMLNITVQFEKVLIIRNKVRYLFSNDA